MMEIARSACLNELVWREVSPVEWRFVGSRNLGVVFENAAMSRSHGSQHTIKLRLQISATSCGMWEGRGADIGAMQGY